MYHYFTAVLIIGFPSLNLGSSFQKDWIWSNSWNTPANWQPPRLPCSNDKIFIDDGTVYVGNKTSGSELVLDSDTEIVFEDNAEIVLTEEKLDSESRPECQNDEKQKVVFKGQPPKDWLNPLNWNYHDLELNQGTPYIERLPCKGDLVVFPKEKSFKVQISKPIIVKELMLKNKAVTNHYLQTYLDSTEGKKRFFLQPSGNLSIDYAIQCPDSGCLCGNQKYKQEICESFQCPSVQCTYLQPVIPIHDCCKRCGALMTFEYEKSLVLKHCWWNLRIFLVTQRKHNDVQLHLSKVNKKEIQIVFTVNSLQGDSLANLIDKVEDFIQSDGDCGGHHFKKVLNPKKINYLEDREDKSTAIMIILLPIILVLIIIILIAFYIWRKRSPVFEFGTSSIPVVSFKNEEYFEDNHEVEIQYATTGFTTSRNEYSNALYAEQDKKKKEDGKTNRLFTVLEEEEEERKDEVKTVTEEVVQINPFYAKLGKEEEHKKNYDMSFVEEVGKFNPLYAELEKEEKDKEVDASRKNDGTDIAESGNYDKEIPVIDFDVKEVS